MSHKIGPRGGCTLFFPLLFLLIFGLWVVQTY